MGRKEEKNETLRMEMKERGELDVQKKEKDAVVTELSSQEKELQKQINAKKKRDRDIQNALAAIVKREIAKAAEEAKKKAIEEKKNEVTTTNPANPTVITTRPGTVAKKPISYLDVSATDVKLNGEFEQNKGKLPWPVDKSFVSIHFGLYTIEGTKLKNNSPDYYRLPAEASLR